MKSMHLVRTFAVLGGVATALAISSVAAADVAASPVLFRSPASTSTPQWARVAAPDLPRLPCSARYGARVVLR